MTLKIEITAEGGRTIIRLSGRLREEHLNELKMQLTGDQSRLALDLSEVTLVDVEVVRFLNACEASSVDVLHCPRYIYEWMLMEKDKKG